MIPFLEIELEVKKGTHKAMLGGLSVTRTEGLDSLSSLATLLSDPEALQKKLQELKLTEAAAKEAVEEANKLISEANKKHKDVQHWHEHLEKEAIKLESRRIEIDELARDVTKAKQEANLDREEAARLKKQTKEEMNKLRAEFQIDVKKSVKQLQDMEAELTVGFNDLESERSKLEQRANLLAEEISKFTKKKAAFEAAVKAGE